MKTNQSGDVLGSKNVKKYDSPVRISRGKEVGFFRMGSTVVMIFEADSAFQFSVKPNDVVRLGQRLN